MRCPDCNKFVPYGEMRTDDVEIDIDESTGVVTMSGEVYLTCEQCGTDLAYASAEAEIDASEAFEEAAEEDDVREGGVMPDISFELVETPNLNPTDRVEDTDRKGKKIKNPRYMKRFYGVEATVKVRRTVRFGDGPEHAEEAEASIEWEEQASGFESCC